MATITLNIPDTQLARVREAMCAYIGLTGTDVTNANAKLGIATIVRNQTKSFEAQKANQRVADEESQIPEPDVT